MESDGSVRRDENRVTRIVEDRSVSEFPGREAPPRRPPGK
jgi:hypothetical protein